MADHVRVRFSKWDGTPHWAFDMERLGEDDHGLWLRADAGTELRRGSEPPILAKHGFVKLITHGRWWTAIWNDGPWRDGRSIRTYVDVITPAVREGDTVRMVDLDLDVVRRSDGTVEVDDEDEFDMHRIAMAYPDHIVDKARTEAARLAIAVQGGAEPFGIVGDRWLEVGRGH
jgi:predicted RNA-binding protein associated with RNAse of E/G family